MQMNYLMLGIGLLILIKGADILVDSASRIAKILKVPSFIVGLFIVAMGTSAPEAAIGFYSGIQGTNLITLGDVVGSGIVNITVVLALTAMVFPLTVDSLVPRREIPISILTQILLGIMLYTGLLLSRIESSALIAGMILFFGYIVSKTIQLQDKETPDTMVEKEVFEYIEDQQVLSEEIGEEETSQLPVYKKESKSKWAVLFLVGLAGLIGGANLAVDNAVEIAHALHLSEEFIGLTVVAFGTSLPELVTCLIAAIKKEADIAIGNVIGSNIFNVLFVLGMSGLIHPISIPEEVFFDLGVMISVSMLLLIQTYFFGKISKRSGFLLFGVYVLYMAFKINSLG